MVVVGAWWWLLLLVLVGVVVGGVCGGGGGDGDVFFMVSVVGVVVAAELIAVPIGIRNCLIAAAACGRLGQAALWRRATKRQGGDGHTVSKSGTS